MPLPIEWSRLDVAAYRISMKRSVRWLAWFETGIGLFVIALGLKGGFLPLVVVGLVLAGAGTWNLLRTSVTGLVVDGIAMILTGVFQLTLGLWSETNRPTSVGKGIVTGLIQIGWGIGRLATYRIARSSVNDPPAIARLEAIVRDLEKRRAKGDPAVVEFRTGALHRKRTRVGLYAEGAVALFGRQAVRLEKRTDIWIESRGTTLRDRTTKVRIQMSDLELNGAMSTEHFERFERWKLGMSQAPPIAA